MTARTRYLTALATCLAAGMTPEQARKLARQIARHYTNSLDEGETR